MKNSIVAEILSQTATASVHGFLKDLNMLPDQSESHYFAQVKKQKEAKS